MCDRLFDGSAAEVSGVSDVKRRLQLAARGRSCTVVDRPPRRRSLQRIVVGVELSSTSKSLRGSPTTCKHTPSFCCYSLQGLQNSTGSGTQSCLRAQHVAFARLKLDSITRTYHMLRSVCGRDSALTYKLISQATFHLQAEQFKKTSLMKNPATCQCSQLQRFATVFTSCNSM